MKLITQQQRELMVVNGIASDAGGDMNPFPVVKLFAPDGAATWLLTELDPDDEDLAFGLCDLGLHCPEIGTVRLSELAAVRGKLGLPIERDRHFKADRRLWDYVRLARQLGYIKT